MFPLMFSSSSGILETKADMCPEGTTSQGEGPVAINANIQAFVLLFFVFVAGQSPSQQDKDAAAVSKHQPTFVSSVVLKLILMLLEPWDKRVPVGRLLVDVVRPGLSHWSLLKLQGSI